MIKSTELLNTHYTTAADAPSTVEIETLAMPSFTKFKGQRMTFHLKCGQTIEGDVTSDLKNFIRLSEPEITSKHFIINPDWVMVDRQAVAYFHPVTDRIQVLDAVGSCWA